MKNRSLALDRIDRQILTALQRDCRTSAETLADSLAASPSTILRRTQRLRDRGVIQAEVAVLNPSMLGRPITIFLTVSLVGENEAQAREFAAHIADQPAVQQCFLVTGADDYLIQLSVADMTEYDQFVRTLIINNSAVRASETRVVIRALKQGLGVVTGA